MKFKFFRKEVKMSFDINGHTVTESQLIAIHCTLTNVISCGVSQMSYVGG